jgi:hypothetical protein
MLHPENPQMPQAQMQKSETQTTAFLMIRSHDLRGSLILQQSMLREEIQGSFRAI